MRQQLEYMIAAALATYIVFLTRPAPSAVTSLLANPLAQLAALGLVVYVGASHSLLLALLLGLAFVLSTPTREYMDATDKPKKDDKNTKDDKKDTDVATVKTAVTAAPAAPAAKPTAKPTAPSTKKTESTPTEPDAAGQKVGKETFTSGIASTAAAF